MLLLAPNRPQSLRFQETLRPVIGQLKRQPVLDTYEGDQARFIPRYWPVVVFRNVVLSGNMKTAEKTHSVGFTDAGAKTQTAHHPNKKPKKQTA
jgi:hypothetical protein